MKNVYVYRVWVDLAAVGQGVQDLVRPVNQEAPHGTTQKIQGTVEVMA